MIFYITVGSEHPLGSGYWEVIAPDENTARKVVAATKQTWCSVYTEFSEMHTLDRRTCHGRLTDEIL